MIDSQRRDCRVLFISKIEQSNQWSNGNKDDKIWNIKKKLNKIFNKNIEQVKFQVK